MKTFLAALLMLVGVNAATAGPACKDTGSLTAKPLAFDANDSDTLLGMSIALIFGFDPATFPAANTAAEQSPCSRGSFVAAKDTYVLHGDNNELPPRWAVSTTDPDRIAFVALMPTPSQALAAYRAAPNSTNMTLGAGGSMYALAITDGDKRQIFRFYSALPPDGVMKADMCTALVGNLPVVAVYDAASQQSDLSGLGKASATEANAATCGH